MKLKEEVRPYPRSRSLPERNFHILVLFLKIGFQNSPHFRCGQVLHPLPGQKYLSTSPSMVLGSSCQVVCPAAALSWSNQTTGSVPLNASLLICRLNGYFVLPSPQSPAYASTPVSSGLYSPFFPSRSALGPFLSLVKCDLPTTSAHRR